MHLTWRQTLAMLVTIGALLGAAGRVCPAAASPLSHSPLVVTMSGTLQPFNEPQSHDLNTLTVTRSGERIEFRDPGKEQHPDRYKVCIGAIANQAPPQGGG